MGQRDRRSNQKKTHCSVCNRRTLTKRNGNCERCGKPK